LTYVAASSSLIGSADIAPRRLTVCWMFAGIGLST
jgi:hypothetical protein